MILKLKECRKNAGYASAKDFADAFGIPVSTYRKHEGGFADMTLTQAMEYANFLGCTIGDIAQDSEVNHAVVKVES